MGDQRGRRGKAVWSDKSAPPKKGPLRCLFDDYAARDDVYDLDDTNDKPSLMSRAEAFQLAHDFDIVAMCRSQSFRDALRPLSGCRECWTPCQAYPSIIHHPVESLANYAKAVIR